MEKKTVSKKALKTLVNDSMRDAIGRLQLPKPTKRLEKLISKTSKKIAVEFADILKKENKKAKAAAKSLTYVEDVLKGKKDKKEKKSSKKRLGVAV
jgi:uncharacterized protein YtpQ (UPF0354 family)